MYLCLVGTGASCIYPLLGTRLNGWSFLATDIDQDSVAIATENVARNGLTHKVKGGSLVIATTEAFVNCYNVLVHPVCNSMIKMLFYVQFNRYTP